MIFSFNDFGWEFLMDIKMDDDIFLDTFEN